MYNRCQDGNRKSVSGDISKRATVWIRVCETVGYRRIHERRLLLANSYVLRTLRTPFDKGYTLYVALQVPNPVADEAMSVSDSSVAPFQRHPWSLDMGQRLRVGLYKQAHWWGTDAKGSFR